VRTNDVFAKRTQFFELFRLLPSAGGPAAADLVSALPDGAAACPPVAVILTLPPMNEVLGKQSIKTAVRPDRVPKALILPPTIAAGASIDIHISKIISRIRLPENLESPAADPHNTSQACAFDRHFAETVATFRWIYKIELSKIATML